MIQALKSVTEHHSLWLVIGSVGVVLLVITIILLVRHHLKNGTTGFAQRWKELQAFCAKKGTWPLAVIEADKLLEEVLKKRHFKGKTMGERLVAAQHSLTSNDSVWFGHKLRNKLVNENYKLKGKNEVKQALLGFLQALKDLGALKNDK
ncbi:MAG TPA: hypothetical protein VLG37_02785 [Candidatus Saccharimonadales bacterium]|nr:hypothetical protein [Candidatus Saccharimonadales bacterium]